MRMYVIGNENCVLGMALVGVQGRMVHNAVELGAALDTALADKSIGLLLVTSDAAAMARERVGRLKVHSMTPLVVEIPGEDPGATSPGLRDFVQRAVGVSLGEGAP